MTAKDRLVIQGKKIKKFRDELSISAEEVAEILELGNRQSVYDLEKGRRDLKAWEAVKLAACFGVSTEALLGGDSSPEMPVSWRGEADPLAENLLRTRLARYMKLEQFADINPDSTLPQYRIDQNASFESIGEIALGVARSLNLGEYPARSLAEALRKKWNVLIFSIPVASGSAACVRKGRTCAVLLNSGDAWWRRNFSLGHELFHLITSETGSIFPDRIEKLANVFSSNLLIPYDSINSEIRKLQKSDSISYFDLMNLAREYMVSTEALLWRMYSLEYIPREDVDRFLQDESLRSLDREIHGFLKREEPALPVDLVFLAYQVYLQGKISIGKLAEYLETSVGMLKKTLTTYGIMPFAPKYETSISHI